MAERATMAELSQELKGTVDHAADLAGELRGRLEELKGGILSQTIAAGERYAEVEYAQDIVEQVELNLKRCKGEEAWLDGYDFEELAGYDETGARDAEDDRKYHEAKDEGRIK
jgi:hypothetical protein